MLFTTEIRALDPHTKEMKTWAGEHVEAPSFSLAQQWCDLHKGYLKVIGILIKEVPAKEDDPNSPDWDKEINYWTTQNN